jgi:hypothetical protein
VSEQLNQIEDMLGQLIKIVGETNAKVTKIDKELSEFRVETSINFKKLDHA